MKRTALTQPRALTSASNPCRRSSTGSDRIGVIEEPPGLRIPSVSAAAIGRQMAASGSTCPSKRAWPYLTTWQHGHVTAAWTSACRGKRESPGRRHPPRQKKTTTLWRLLALLLSERRIALPGSRHGHGQLERRSTSPGPRHGRRDVESRFRLATRKASADRARRGGTPGHRASSRRDGLSRLLASLATHARRRGCFSSHVSGARPKTPYSSQARLVGELAPWSGVSRVGPGQATSQCPATARIPSTNCPHDASRRPHLAGMA